MHIVLAFVAIASAAAFWIIRARNMADATGDLVDMANDVRLAARRFGFKRRANIHPAESVDDPQLAIATIGQAFLELDDLPAREQQFALGRSVQRELGLTLSDAEEMPVFARWLIGECKGPENAVTRLARRLYKLDSAGSWDRLMGVIKEVSTAGQGLSARQTEALSDIKQAFRIR